MRSLQYFVFVVVFLGMVNTSYALVITDTVSFYLNSSVTTQVNKDPKSAEDTTFTELDFDGFDSSLGNLTRVNVLLGTFRDYAFGVNVTDPSTGVFAEDNVAGYSEHSIDSRVKIINPDLGSPATGRHINNYNTSLSCTDSDGSCLDSIDPLGTDLKVILFDTTDIDVMDTFIGTTLKLRATNYVSASVTNCPDDEDLCYAYSSAYYQGDVKVSYFYDELPVIEDPVPTSPTRSIPEPSSFALLLLGMFGLRLSRNTTNVKS